MEWVRLTDFVTQQRKKRQHYNPTMSKIDPNVEIPHLTFLIKCLYNLCEAGETAIPTLRNVSVGRAETKF